VAVFERFTEEAKRALFFSRLVLTEVGGREITPEHLLLGLLRDTLLPGERPLSPITIGPSGVTATMLAGVPAQHVRHILETAVADAGQLAESVEVPLSDASKQVLNHAVTEADSFHHDEVGTEHLLLAILHHAGTLASQVLAEHGVRYDTARAVVPSTGRA
jgi:ATP-dependent Clp protease ATP-binding subunit ClpC